MVRMQNCVILLLVAALLYGCGPTKQPETGGVWPMCVMVDGTLYAIFGDNSEVIPEECDIAGYITSCVDNNGPFTQDDQANFSDAVGQPYAVVDGQLLLLLRGSWKVCEPQ